MTLKEFDISIRRNELLGMLLPLELRRTYPRFSLENGKLRASFAGFKLLLENGAVNAMPPAYRLEIGYPRCELLLYERLSPADKAAKPMTERVPEDVKRLAGLCDDVLSLFDSGSDKLEDTLAEYNALLENILEAEQLAALGLGGEN